MDDDKIREVDPPIIMPDGREVRRIDFSGFHPLDHSIWACRDYPGGRRTHLNYAWNFKWREEVWRWTWCLVGRHDWTTVWRGPGDARFHATSVPQQWIQCRGCGRKKDDDE